MSDTMNACSRVCAQVSIDVNHVVSIFDGWGTSLAWFANALGDLGERHYSDDTQVNARAQEYGAKLRDQVYESIFGTQGLHLNMARFNVGGGNASDVAYGYPFTRQGAAVPGYWRADPDGTQGVYGSIATVQRNKALVAKAFDPDNEGHYDFSHGGAQEWWLKEGARRDDIDHVEVFANSAPWFLTVSGYATGGFDPGRDNLADPERFARYLAHCAKHVEQSCGIPVNTIDPLNEPEIVEAWCTPGHMATDVLSETVGSAGAGDRDTQRHRELIGRYGTLTGKADLAITPYSIVQHKPQEGMHVDPDNQARTIIALHQALRDVGMHAAIAASDATRAAHFVQSYGKWPQEVRDMVGQYNVHSYQHDGQAEAAAIARRDGKPLSMSEIDGSWVEGGFAPWDFGNALGIAVEINHDVYTLGSKDFTFWQVVEDLYNQAEPRCGAANPAGEDGNWGMLLVDFDPEVVDDSGLLYSKRRVDNRLGNVDGLAPCRVYANMKFNGMRAYTQFVHEGDRIVRNDDTEYAFSAVGADGKTVTLIYANTREHELELTVSVSDMNLSGARGSLYISCGLPDGRMQPADIPLVEDLLKISNVPQIDGSVLVDDTHRTIRVVVPARSIASLVIAEQSE